MRVKSAWVAGLRFASIQVYVEHTEPGMPAADLPQAVIQRDFYAAADSSGSRFENVCIKQKTTEMISAFGIR